MKQYCDDFNQIIGDKTMSSYIVKNSIPIIWFGDLERYQASPVKIVTVGLNPSWHEFLEKDKTPLKNPRFKYIDLSSPDENNLNELYSTLNEYFYVNPFSFFKQYEKILQGIGASFYQAGYSNIALHADAYTPFATDPFFGKLSSDVQWQLKARGMALHQNLIKYLCPDVILISVAKDVFFEIHTDVTLEEVDVDPRTKGVYILKSSRAKNGHNQKIILGKNFKGTPFGGRPTNETIRILQRMLAGTVNTK